MELEGNIVRIGKMTNAHKISVGKSEEKRILGRRLLINGTIILKWILPNKVGWKDVIWIRLDQYRGQFRAVV
jgi:hypothetical protein